MAITLGTIASQRAFGAAASVSVDAGVGSDRLLLGFMLRSAQARMPKRRR